MKRALVTGGAGFIGSHLCEKLLDENYEVICLDNLMSGQMMNVDRFKDNPNFSFIQHDVVESYSIDGSLDEVYHLACPASPPHYQKDPIHTAKTCFLGTLNTAEVASQKGARILHTSTSEVYGDPDVHPQPEEYRGNVNPHGIRSCYDEGKRIAETLLFDLHRQNNLDIRVVRIFNTYGPRMYEHDGRVVSNFVLQAIQNQDITIYGDGLQTRSFCYVGDLIDGFRKFMNQDNFIGPVNMGNPEEHTILGFAQLVVELANSNSNIKQTRPLPSDDPKKRRPDISLAWEKLKWKPTTDVRTGVSKTIDYFRNLLNNRK